MTRIFTDGAEFGDVLFWDSGSAAASTTQKRTGSYSYVVTSSNSGTKIITAVAEIYARFCWWNAGPNEGRLFYWQKGSTELGSLRTETGARIGLYTGASTLVDTSDTSYVTSAWNLMEIHVKIANSPDGIIELYMNGILTATFYGDTQPGADTTIDSLVYRGPQQTYFDDLALNDTSNADGRGDNSWCGDGHVELLVANDNGDTNEWVGSDGDSVNNYALVDDIPASGTDYVKASTDIKDMYNVGDYTPTGKIVTRVWAECRAMDNNAQSGSIWLGFKHGGVEYLSSAVRALTNVYNEVVGDYAKTDPSDSTTWSEADLDAIQFVVECSSSSSTSSSSTSSSTTTSSSSAPP
jgi:hypothetical protein